MQRFVNYNPGGPISYMVSPGPPGSSPVTVPNGPRMVSPVMMTPGSSPMTVPNGPRMVSPVMMIDLPPGPDGPRMVAHMRQRDPGLMDTTDAAFQAKGIRRPEDLSYSTRPDKRQRETGFYSFVPSVMDKDTKEVRQLNLVPPDQYASRVSPETVGWEPMGGFRLPTPIPVQVDPWADRRPVVVSPTPSPEVVLRENAMRLIQRADEQKALSQARMNFVPIEGQPRGAPGPVVVSPTPRPASRPLVDTISEIQEIVDRGDALLEFEMEDMLRKRSPLTTEADLGDSFASLNDAGEELAGELKDFAKSFNKMGKKLRVGIDPIPRVGPGVMPSVVEPPDAVHTPEEAAAALDQEKILDEKERVDWYDKMSHPLSNEWVQKLPGIPFEKKPGEACMMDCKERQRVKELECDEIRRRVITKLKEVGCPTRAIPIKESIGCNIKK